MAHRAENAAEAVSKLMHNCPRLKNFGFIEAKEIPNGIIIE